MATIVIYDPSTKNVKDIIYSAHTPAYLDRNDVIVLTKEQVLPETNPNYLKISDGGRVISKTLSEKEAYDISTIPTPRMDLEAEVTALKARIEALEADKVVK